MSLRQKLERKLKEKQQEIQELEDALHAARAYVQAMQDTLKIVQKEGDVGTIESDVEDQVVLKAGSSVEAAVKVLRENGSAMQIMDLLKAMGREQTPENRASLVSSLASYVRRGTIFTRPAPNTYGLVEWGTEGPPDDFGVSKVDNA